MQACEPYELEIATAIADEALLQLINQTLLEFLLMDLCMLSCFMFE
jgi:hypothetical protein